MFPFFVSNQSMTCRQYNDLYFYQLLLLNGLIFLLKLCERYHREILFVRAVITQSLDLD